MLFFYARLVIREQEPSECTADDDIDDKDEECDPKGLLAVLLDGKFLFGG